MKPALIRLYGHLFAPDDRGLCVVTVADGLVADIVPREPTVPTAALPEGCLGGPNSMILPGLIDLQINGAFGYDFADPAADIAAICRQMPRFGVTAFLPTIVPSRPEVYVPALDNLRRAAAPGESRVLGAHAEGPFINPVQRGTHDPAQIRRPSVEEAAQWLEAGTLRLVTLAPELPGAIELTAFLTKAGVRVAMGHTDATWEQAEFAGAAGATIATHVFNTMRPFRHRDPGVAGYALATGLMTSVIADGHHLADGTLRLLARTKSPDELFVISDALPGFGLPPGRYSIAGRDYVSDGLAARLPDGTLTGGLLPLNLVLRNLVENVGLDRSAAIRLVTVNPARAIGVDDRLGRVEIGREADIVLLDEAWAVRATVVGGSLGYRGGQHSIRR